MPGPRRVGGADRINPQLLAKFASEIRVSTHWREATEAARRPSAILLGMDRDLYRRRQRRRAIIAWSVLGLVVVAVGLTVAFGDEGTSASDSTDTSLVHLFSAEMTSAEYDQIHPGQSESSVLDRLGSTGLQESEAEPELLALFPPRPSSSTCSYWTLSDAPGHHVRLCFSDPQGVLKQKTVRAPGEGGAETTLA
jgi:hypothetical protein